MSLTKFSIALAAMFTASTAAQAGVITVDPSDIGTSFTVNYDGFSDGRVIEGLTGQTTFTLTGVSGASYSFSYTVTNTSSDPIDASRISIFGFDTDPDIISASSTGTFNQTATNGNVPNGFGQVELCFKGGSGPSCSGGGRSGVNLGDSTTGALTLNFSALPDELTLSNFFIRYQAIEGDGASGSATGRSTLGSPEGSTGSTGGGTRSTSRRSGSTGSTGGYTGSSGGNVGSSGGSTGGYTGSSGGNAGSSGASSGGSTGGTPVPAPAGIWLFAAGLGGIGWRMGRRQVK